MNTFFFDHITNIIGKLTAFGVAYYGYKKYAEQRRLKKNPMYKATDGILEINAVITKLEKGIKSTKSICTLAELSNGGGVPKLDKPLYIRALNSTNIQSINLWGERVLCILPVIKAIHEMYLNRFGSLLISDYNMTNVETWANANNINKVFYYFIGGDGTKRSLVLAVNTATTNDVSIEEKLKIYEACSEIKRIINAERKWFWQTKLE